MQQKEERRARLLNALAFVPGNFITMTLFRNMANEGRDILPAALTIVGACTLLVLVIEVYFRQQRRVREEADWGLSRQANGQLLFGGIGVGALVALMLAVL